MSSIFDWSLTAANNANADSSVNWQEGQLPSTVNDSARAMMTRVAQLLKDIGGTVTAGGTANAITVTSNSPITSYATGQIVGFKASATNSAATTLNVNGIGAKAIRSNTPAFDTALAGGEIVDDGVYVCIYDASLNAAAGGWLLFNPNINLSTKADTTAVGSWIDGLLLSNNTTNPNTHVDFAAGSARSGSSFVTSASTMAKRLNGTWAVGTGNGGLDAGAVAANATYFAYALRKDSDLSFDVVLSTSATIGGVTTTLLTGYTIVKQIGVVLTDGSSVIRPFTMYPRDEYTFTTPIKDAVNLATSTTSALLALTVPNGVKAKAKLRIQFTSTATTNALLVHDTAQGTLAAGVTSDGGIAGAIQVASGFAIGSSEIWTNTSRQVRHVAGAAGNIWVWTDGFHFPCGRVA